MGDSVGEGSAYCNIVRTFHRLGDFKTAKDCAERHLEIATTSGDRPGEGIAYGNLGTLFESLGKFQEALKYYQLSVTLLNNLRDRLKHNDDWKLSLRDTYQETYTKLWGLLLKEGKVMDALITAEQGRAQGLKDLMALNYFFETTDAEPGNESGVIQELLNDFSSNTIFIAIGRTELIFWVCQDGKVVELRRKEIDCSNEISTFFQSLVLVAGQDTGATDYVNCEDRSLNKERFKRLVVKSSRDDDRETQSFITEKSALNIVRHNNRSHFRPVGLQRARIFTGRFSVLGSFCCFQSPKFSILL